MCMGLSPNRREDFPKKEIQIAGRLAWKSKIFISTLLMLFENNNSISTQNII